MNRHNLHRVVGLLFLSILTGSAHAEYVPFDGAKSTWHDGFVRYDYVLDTATGEIKPFERPVNEKFGIGTPKQGQRRCIVIAPKEPAAGNPWSWRGCYWDHQPQTEVELLRRGFHVCYISADQTLKPDKNWETWYAFLTEKHGLSTKPAFVGMSRGGEYSFIWATTHPDKVSCLYSDNPGGNDENMRRLGDVARQDVPVLLVCGTIDPILARFGLAIENIYHQFNGRVSVILKEGAGHHPHSLRDPKPIADFIEQSVREQAPAVPAFATDHKVTHSTYYSFDESYEHNAKDGYYLIKRGPAFNDHYDRWDVTLGFAQPITIIAPNKEAAGKPWVYRAGYVARDAKVDQALLAAGYHIVVAPMGFNADGPVFAEWDKLYAYLTDHGFAKKPVMEGAGGAAGAVYAWAVNNPEKVSCIYAENPILHVDGVKVQPLDNLAPLAKAGVPILNVCGSLDPALTEQTQVAEKRYQEAGGKVTVTVREGQGHSLSSTVTDVAAVLEFIKSHP